MQTRSKPWTPPPFQPPVRTTTPVQQPTNPVQMQGNGLNFIDSSTGQLGYALGSQMYSRVSENVNLEKVVSLGQLRTLFKVDHSYVLKKLGLILFPFRHSDWSRIGSVDLGYKTPKDDLNAPDLYIPVMSFVTFVLLSGISFGISHKFTPDLLGITSSTALFLIGLEVLLIKGGSYFLNLNSNSWTELIAYTGYKFVPLDLLKGIQLFSFSRLVLYGVFLYLMVCFGFFTLRSTRYLVLGESGSSELIGKQARKKRIVFLFLIAGIQLLDCWILL